MKPEIKRWKAGHLTRDVEVVQAEDYDADMAAKDAEIAEQIKIIRATEERELKQLNRISELERKVAQLSSENRDDRVRLNQCLAELEASRGDVAALLEACEQLKVDAEYLASDIVSEPAQHPSRVKAFHTMYRLVDRVVLAHTERTKARQPLPFAAQDWSKRAGDTDVPDKGEGEA